MDGKKFLWAVVELAGQPSPGTCFRNWGKLFLGGGSLCGLCYKPWLRGSAGEAAGGLDAAGRDVLCGDLSVGKATQAAWTVEPGSKSLPPEVSSRTLCGQSMPAYWKTPCHLAKKNYLRAQIYFYTVGKWVNGKWEGTRWVIGTVYPLEIQLPEESLEHIQTPQ